jgi:hypothetical protein
MKKAIVILGAALLLAGCDQNKGGSSDTYSTGRGTSGSAMTNPSSSSYSSTNQGAATTPEGSSSGKSSSTNGASSNP